MLSPIGYSVPQFQPGISISDNEIFHMKSQASSLHVFSKEGDNIRNAMSPSFKREYAALSVRGNRIIILVLN